MTGTAPSINTAAIALITIHPCRAPLEPSPPSREFSLRAPPRVQILHLRSLARVGRCSIALGVQCAEERGGLIVPEEVPLPSYRSDRICRYQ
jgi:hypothetical protein